MEPVIDTSVALPSSRLKLGWIPVAVAIVAAVMLGLSGTGVRLGWWDYRIGFGVVRWSAYLAIAAALVALIALAIPKLRRGRVAALVGGLLVGLAVMAMPLSFIVAARSVPPIHDITTDTDNPPRFDAIAPLRANAPNGVDYGGKEVADAQHQGFPEIKPLDVPLPPPAAYAKALAAAREMGWEIVAADASAGRIEATATTRFFAFKDDIVVRITPNGTGSRIDVRSASRVGKSDIGTNAKRVREYLGSLAK